MDLLGSKYVSEYRNEGYLPTSRRVYASLLDSFLLFIVSFCCLLASNAIAGSIPSYASKISSINSLRVEMYQEQEETKLFSFEKNPDGTSNYEVLVNQNDVFKDYCYENILYTYSLHQEAWDAKFTLPNDNPLKELSGEGYHATSYQSDRLAYFFTGYAEGHNQNNNLFPLKEGETYALHYKNVLRDASKGANWDYFQGEDTLPALKMDYAHTLYRYLRFEEGGQEGLTSYNYLMAQYQTVFDQTKDMLFKSDAYQAIYQPYRALYAECSHVISLFSFLSYIVSFGLVILLPSLLFKNGETIGLYAFGGALLHKERLEVSKGQILLRNLVSFFSFFPVMLFSCFFAGGLNSGWMYPLFTIGNVGVSLFNITVILFILPIINVFCALLRKDKRSLNELASNTIVIDRRYHQEHHLEEEALEESEKEVKAVENVLPDRPYFDSTCFNNTERQEKNNEEKDTAD